MITIGHFIPYHLWKIPIVFIHKLCDSKLRHWPYTWHARIDVNHGFNLSKKFGSSFYIRTIRVKLYLCYHNRTHLTLFELSVEESVWDLSTLKSSYWSFRCECQLVQYVSKFPEEWNASWCCFPQRQWPGCSSLVNLGRKLETKCMHEINYQKMSTIYPSHSLSVCQSLSFSLYIFIYIYKLYIYMIKISGKMAKQNTENIFLSLLEIELHQNHSF